MLATWMLLGMLLAPRASGQEPPEPDPLVEADGLDTLALARAADRMGDAAVLDRLSDDRPVVVRMAAARAAPFLRAPEDALAPLAALAAGRDPHLSAVAALSAYRICRDLDADDLARHEVDPASLSEVRQRLHALSRDATARADIRRLAGFAAAALAAAGVPEPS